MPDIKYLNLNGTTYNITDAGSQEKIETLTSYVNAATELSNSLKDAAGANVGSTFIADVSFGQLIWHNGLLYRTTAPISYNSSWDANKVVQTTISDEINALRGVASETVVLTITPASAIPVEGVIVKIHNLTSDTYTNEITFTTDDNRKTLGSIQYGDVYTIIMPEIDGYTQPADQTFQAGQILRDRTVQYWPTTNNIESITLYATTSNNVSIPSRTNVIVTVYTQEGTVSETLSIDISSGISATFNIPFGSKYSIVWPTISGYYTPKTTTLVAGVSSRNIRARYLYIVVDDAMVVLKDLTEISFEEIDAVQQAFDNDNVLGIAFHPIYTSRTISGSTYTRPSTVSIEDFHFMYVFGKTTLVTGYSWDSTNGDVLSNTDLTVRATTPNNSAAWTGEANSDYMYQKIIDYETNSGVTVSDNVFKYVHGISLPTELQGTGRHFFLPSAEQWYFYSQKVHAVNTAIAGFTTQYSLGEPGNNSKMTSSEYSNNKVTSLGSVTSAYDGNRDKNTLSGMFQIALFPIVSTIIE